MLLLDRYLLRNLVLPFFIGLVTFMVIMLAEVAWRMSGLLIGQRVSAALLAEYFLLSAPRVAVWSAPVGILVAVSMAMTSLQRHGEVTAIRGAGASLTRIEGPWLVGAAAVSALAVWMNQAVVPKTTARAEEVFEQMTYQAPVAKQAWDELFRSPDGRLFYVHKLDAEQNTLEGVTIWAFDERGRLRSMTVARRAAVQGRRWTLIDGYTRRFDERGEPLGPPEPFQHQPVELWEAIHQYYAEKRTPYEMSITELRDLARVLEDSGRDAHQLRVHLHFKYSIPCAALVFALLAGPLAHRYARLGSFAGLVLAIVILFLYNGARSWTLALGLAGSIPPAVAGWLPNVLFGAVGVWLMATQR
ncbi:MAG: LptF/LptG family permease [Armatimonadetes bacterium]|nr:LptF/LptG family permease [Armatimonadota bacterium]